MSNLPKVSVADLLDAGVHFGHKTSRWNPKMSPYIYGTRDHIHIMDLQQTAPLMDNALRKIYEVVKNNGKVLFVGSKVQATDLVSEYAEKCGQFYVNNRWLGGMLTNWGTISRSIKKLDDTEKLLEDEEKIESYTKKEVLDLERTKSKLLKSFAGIRNIGVRPDLLIVIDTNKEHLAVNEAVKLGIPIVAVVDSNSDPESINYPIPGNDDAIRSIRFYCNAFADAALAGIQDSLASSGVDVGLSEDIDGDSLDNVVKIEKTAKVSKIIKEAEPKKTESTSKSTKDNKKDSDVKVKKEKAEQTVKAEPKKVEPKKEAVKKEPKKQDSSDVKAKTAKGDKPEVDVKDKK